MHQLVSELADENNHVHGRQLAGIYFKNLLKSDVCVSSIYLLVIPLVYVSWFYILSMLSIER